MNTVPVVFKKAQNPILSDDTLRFFKNETIAEIPVDFIKIPKVYQKYVDIFQSTRTMQLRRSYTLFSYPKFDYSVPEPATYVPKLAAYYLSNLSSATFQIGRTSKFSIKCCWMVMKSVQTQ
jgi:hypothetical protein